MPAAADPAGAYFLNAPKCPSVPTVKSVTQTASMTMRSLPRPQHLFFISQKIEPASNNPDAANRIVLAVCDMSNSVAPLPNKTKSNGNPQQQKCMHTVAIVPKSAIFFIFIFLNFREGGNPLFDKCNFASQN
jgi:hypothetical protein